MRAAQASESYFISKLAETAQQDAVAAPATIESLAARLQEYLPNAQTDQVVAAYNYAEEAHRGQGRRTGHPYICLLYTSPSPRDATLSRMPSSA